uniref:Putative secreted protein n=1 Tax=Ixodes ricinus TaxID=34613 RepID=A0A6B0V331_IXORI
MESSWLARLPLGTTLCGLAYAGSLTGVGEPWSCCSCWGWIGDWGPWPFRLKSESDAMRSSNSLVAEDAVGVGLVYVRVAFGGGGREGCVGCGTAFWRSSRRYSMVGSISYERGDDGGRYRTGDVGDSDRWPLGTWDVTSCVTSTTLLLDVGGDKVVMAGGGNLAVFRSSSRLSSSDRLLPRGDLRGVGGLPAPSSRRLLRGDLGDEGDDVLVVVVVTSRTMYWFW